MRVLIAGGQGMLGRAVALECLRRGWEALAMARAELDISDPESVASAPWEGVNAAINCAAYTKVDLAETERQEAFEANTLGAGYFAAAAQQAGASLVHVSTDFVFDGRKVTPYTEEDPTFPLGFYGASKLEGESSVLAGHAQAIVARTSWLYGDVGKCFPRTILDAFRAGKTLRVVVDQIGCPTYVPELARVLCDLLEKRAFPGIYHASGEDAMSWHAFAQAAIDEFLSGESPSPGGRGAGERGTPEASVQPIRTEDWPTPAPRPAYSVLDNSKLRSLGIPPMRPFAECLGAFLAAYRKSVTGAG